MLAQKTINTEFKVSFYDVSGKLKKEQNIVCSADFRPASKKLITKTILNYLNSLRHPIAHAKTKGEVSGGGKKPWKQKGTGRARAGSIRSPLWKGGGIIFGPRNTRNFQTKINREVKRKIFVTALLNKINDKKLAILEKNDTAQYKTKFFSVVLKNIFQLTPKSKTKILFVYGSADASMVKAASNIKRLSCISLSALNFYSILENDVLLISDDSFKALLDSLKNVLSAKN
jgi:large subunit ribosomal protein L4